MVRKFLTAQALFSGSLSMQVFIDDKGRYKANTGYGNLSRNYGKALSQAGVDVLYAPYTSSEWSPNISDVTREEFSDSVAFGEWQRSDIALTVSTPCGREITGMKNLIYTQNALAGMKSDWGVALRTYDAVIVPGRFDVPYFEQWNPQVYTCPQLVDSRIFVNRPKWREEGEEKFTFVFVGSFSYRKGVDLLIKAFCEFSQQEGNASKLVLVCPGTRNVNFLLRMLRENNAHADVDIYIDDVSQEWVCRYINRADVFISLSRGEGWCMPLFESILAKKPCIVPHSTAMGECSPDTPSIIKLPVTLTPVSEIDSDFGKSFKANYQENATASYDVEIRDVVEAMHTMKAEFAQYSLATEEAHEETLNNYSYLNVGERLKSLLSEAL